MGRWGLVGVAWLVCGVRVAVMHWWSWSVVVIVGSIRGEVDKVHGALRVGGNERATAKHGDGGVWGYEYEAVEAGW